MSISDLIPTFSTALSINLLLAFLVVYETVWIVYARFFHPLRKVPGPFLASVSRIWIIWNVSRADCEKTQRQLHEQYGMPVL